MFPATTAAELTGGLGVYLREHCGMTVGWERGGGTHVFTPKHWPEVGTPVSVSHCIPHRNLISRGSSERHGCGCSGRGPCRTRT